MDITQLLTFGVEQGASDCHLSAGEPPMLRIHGELKKLDHPLLTREEVHDMIFDMMNDAQRKVFQEHHECDFSFEMGEIARFRVNVYLQRRGDGAVFRTIPTKILALEQLGMPPILRQLCDKEKGLVLVTGPTGSGKSTTLAAMIDHRNSTSPGHIITVEDPVEFVHRHKKSVITQREVGFDTMSFQAALKNTLRQAPDVILIGEIRDTETMEAGIAFAETGHLCLGTLHANNSNQAIERIMNFFPSERHAQIYLQLSMNLRAIISQRLVPGVDGKRVAAMEILMDTPRVKDLIKKGQVDQLKDAMEQGVQEGCQTFDYVLFTLYRDGKISLEQALINADSANNLRLKIKLAGLKTDDGPADAPAAAAKTEKDKGSAFQIKGTEGPAAGTPTRRL